LAFKAFWRVPLQFQPPLEVGAEAYSSEAVCCFTSGGGWFFDGKAAGVRDVYLDDHSYM
jgi:hypothetical protein